MTDQKSEVIPKLSSDSSSGLSSVTTDSTGRPRAPGPTLSSLPLTVPRIWSSSTEEEDSSELLSTLAVAKLLFERSKPSNDLETLSDRHMLQDYFSTNDVAPAAVTAKPVLRVQDSDVGLEVDNVDVSDKDGSDSYTPTPRASCPDTTELPGRTGKLSSADLQGHPIVQRQPPKSVDFGFSDGEPKLLRGVQPPQVPPRPTAAVLQSNNLPSEARNPALLSDKPAHPASLSALFRSLSVPMVSAVKLGENAVNGGAFADVWRGLMQPGDQQVALKILRLHLRGTDSQRLYNAIAREVSVWARLDHPNILPFLGITPQSDGNGLWLVSPWMEAGDVKMYLTSYPYVDRVALTKGIASGVAYLHRCMIAHGDIKANNVLVDNQGQPRLADFGLSLVLDDVLPEQTTSIMFAGSVRWMAPERINPSRFGLTTATCRTLAGDVFSLAMTLYEVFTMRLPYHELSQMNVPSAIINGERPPHPGNDSKTLGLSSAIWSFMEQCWDEVPQRRPVLAEIWETLDETLSRPSDTPRNMTPLPGQIIGNGAVLEHMPRTTDLATLNAWANSQLTVDATARRARPHVYPREGSQSSPISSVPTRRTTVPDTLVTEDRPPSSGEDIRRPESALSSWPFGKFIEDVAERGDLRTHSLSDSAPLPSLNTAILNHRPLPLIDLHSSKGAPASLTSSMVSRNEKDQPSPTEDGTILLRRANSMPSFIPSRTVDKPMNVPQPLDPPSAMVPGLSINAPQKSAFQPDLSVAGISSAAAGQSVKGAQGSVLPPAPSADFHAGLGVLKPQPASTSLASRNSVRDLKPRGRSGAVQENTPQLDREVGTIESETFKSGLEKHPWFKVPDSELTASVSQESPGAQALEDTWLPSADQTTRERTLAIELQGTLGSHVSIVEAVKLEQGPCAGGAFADVWRGGLGGTQLLVAIKVLRVNLSGVNEACLRERFLREARVWAPLQHQNILPLLGVCHGHSGGQLWLVSPWMEHGEISSYLQAHPSSDRLKLLRGIARGLSYLHSLPVIHGDIKPKNILVNAEGQPGIADFGLSNLLGDESSERLTSGVYGGSLRWMAPERMQPKLFGLVGATCWTTASDIYALGMTAYEIFSGLKPFSEIGEPGIMMEVPKGRRPDHPGEVAIRRGMTLPVWRLIERCWAQQPDRRPRAERILLVLSVLHLCRAKRLSSD